MLEPLCSGCNDDGVVLIVHAQLIQDVRNVHSMFIAVCELPLKDTHCEDVTYRSCCSLSLVIHVVCSGCSTLLHTAQIPAETVLA